MDFSNKNLWRLFEINGHTVYLTQSLLATWIIMAILIVFAVVVRIWLPRFKGVPKGFQNVVEAMVEIMENFAKSFMGDSSREFGGYFFTIFAFILLSNYSGMFGLRPPTADLATTAALGLMTFFILHVTGIRKQKVGYLKEYISPNPIFLPINLISEISKPISLAFRLFGNVLGGVIIVGIIYEMLPLALTFLLPDLLHVYFDIFVGALQAFIFTVLSMTFVAQKAGTV